MLCSWFCFNSMNAGISRASLFEHQSITCKVYFSDVALLEDSGSHHRFQLRSRRTSTQNTTSEHNNSITAHTRCFCNVKKHSRCFHGFSHLAETPQPMERVPSRLLCRCHGCWWTLGGWIHTAGSVYQLSSLTKQPSSVHRRLCLQTLFGFPSTPAHFLVHQRASET